MTAHIAKGRLKLLGTGSSFPGEAVDNDTLLNHLEQSCGARLTRKAGIILKHLGIEERFLTRRLDRALSKPVVDAPDLSVTAIKQALGEFQPDDLGYLISHTSSPHTLLPSSAAWIAERMPLTAPYMELRQACTGFANALQIAQAMMDSNPKGKPIILNGTETGSVYFDINPEFIDTHQLVNYVQMGDGSGAALVGPDDGSERSIISHCFSGHIGINKAPGFYLQGGGSQQAWCEKGLPAFIHDPKAVRESGPELFLKGLETVQEMGFELDDFDYFIPHQANGHIDQLLGQALDIDPAKIVNDAKWLGNLGSAAIWVSFDRLVRSGKLKQGSKVLILGAEATKYMYGGFIYSH
ncbi:3-oxoacyl-ACP synthase [Endozoicomonas sp. OPT23]|uniref:3-oxoacyl-ACP synthase III family protein n=1 Tax=Endozoicomonas sp. OPT23 TaxID=2072845 RepID=UPI00129B43E3|nr:3-oxoacyl-[acyl-carrier-protein] synthase III C-terminal domain-containing protein [Endozoicomonas sp. OPT23]MRI34793.1 3-oxoacyl-ACP synthase [Endozoicomonas sp. OPT23]